MELLRTLSRSGRIYNQFYTPTNFKFINRPECTNCAFVNENCSICFNCCAELTQEVPQDCC